MKVLANDPEKGQTLGVPEVLDMALVENAKNGMMFLPLESEKLKLVYPNDSPCAIWLFPYRRVSILLFRKLFNSKNCFETATKKHRLDKIADQEKACK